MLSSAKPIAPQFRRNQRIVVKNDSRKATFLGYDTRQPDTAVVEFFTPAGRSTFALRKVADLTPAF